MEQKPGLQKILSGGVVNNDIDDFDYPFAENEREQLTFLLNYSIYSPSHRNQQPWRFVVRENYIEVKQDSTKKLSYIDPDRRQLIISCGACINTLEIASRYFGHLLCVEHYSERESETIAKLYFSKKARAHQKDIKLFQSLKVRQTNRSEYRKEALPANTVSECIKIAQEYDTELKIESSDELKSSLAKINNAATRIQYKQPWYRNEFASSLRSQLLQQKDGIFNRGHSYSNLPSSIAKYMIKQFDTGRSVAEFFSEVIACHSPSIFLLSTPRDNPKNWVNCGRALNHILNYLTCEQWSASFINSAIEVKHMRTQVGSLFDTGFEPQILLRVGKGPNVFRTGRRPIDTFIDKK